MFEKTELGHAREIIDSLVEIVPDRQANWNAVTFAQKLDRLAELIDVLRFDAGCPQEDAPLRTFHPNGIFVDVSAGKIHFVRNGPTERLDDEASQKLMLPLLDYLYTHPGKGKPVLSIIRAFVREYFPRCRLRDFQRTATGVLRIETNVRFAAHKLRKIGLLQFSEVEAFKTWRLSLLGILAGNHYAGGNYDQKEAVPTSFWLFTIMGRLELMRSTPTLLARLEGIAKAASIPWTAKEQFLRLTMDTISEYRSALSPEKDLNKHQRQGLIEDLLTRLNSAPEAESIVCAFDGVPQPQLVLIARTQLRRLLR